MQTRTQKRPGFTCGPGVWLTRVAMSLWLLLIMPAVQADTVIGLDQFRDLSLALEHYQRLARSGQWLPIPSQPPQSAIERAEERELLINQLTLSGDLAAVQQRVAVAAVTNTDISRGLMRFQARHGLEVDGFLGRETRRALNLSPYRKAEVIAANLMRLQELPMWPGERYLVVNVGGFRLDLVEQNHSVLSMKVIAGRNSRRTPVHSDLVRQVVINPPWNVPNRIQRLDILPKLRQNPNYLKEQNYVLVQYRADGQRVLGTDHVDWESIEWDQQAIARFPYNLRQMPGNGNSLGRFKFDFPNRYSVYLHDTPAKKLFERQVRAFSSGCVRVEKPRELAEALLRFNRDWHPEQIDEWLQAGRTRYVSLNRQVPIHLVYQTAWVDEEGVLQFRRDVYRRDQPPRGFSLGWRPQQHLLSRSN